MDLAIERQLAAVRALKALRIASIVQDLADAAIAFNDIQGGVLRRGAPGRRGEKQRKGGGSWPVLKLSEHLPVPSSFIPLLPFSDLVLPGMPSTGGTNPVLRHPATIAIAGLISGSISFHKNWTAL